MTKSENNHIIVLILCRFVNIVISLGVLMSKIFNVLHKPVSSDFIHVVDGILLNDKDYIYNNILFLIMKSRYENMIVLFSELLELSFEDLHHYLMGFQMKLNQSKREFYAKTHSDFDALILKGSSHFKLPFVNYLIGVDEGDIEKFLLSTSLNDGYIDDFLDILDNNHYYLNLKNDVETYHSFLMSAVSYLLPINFECSCWDLGGYLFLDNKSKEYEFIKSLNRNDFVFYGNELYDDFLNDYGEMNWQVFLKTKMNKLLYQGEYLTINNPNNPLYDFFNGKTLLSLLNMISPDFISALSSQHPTREWIDKMNLFLNALPQETDGIKRFNNYPVQQLIHHQFEDGFLQKIHPTYRKIKEVRNAIKLIST